MRPENKKSGNLRILLRADASVCEKFAAEELTRYLGRCVGLRPETVTEVGTDEHFFSLGKTEQRARASFFAEETRMVHDGFCIFSENGNVFLDSPTHRGVLYAVYEYLERYLGVRFLTRDCEWTPKTDFLPLPEEALVTKPSFAMRTYLTADVFQEHADENFLARTRTKDVFTRIPEKCGGSAPVYGRNVSHNFHYYVPFEKYGNEHPEFYRFFYENAEILPTIDITNGITDAGELDESMPVSVAKIVISEMIEDLKKFSDVEIFTLTQEDGPHYCENERNLEHEQKFMRSGMLIRFCNVVVRALNAYTKEHMNGRRVQLMTFAYDYAKEAPVREIDGRIEPLDSTVVADENIIVQYALFSNAAYPYFDERQEEHVRRAMRQWRVIAKRFWFWAYDVNFNRYIGYFDSFAHIKNNIEGFQRYGIEYLCMQGSHDAHGNWQSNLRGYVYRKLMWDSSLDADALIEEYLRIYYAEGAEAVREVMSVFHAHYQKLLAEGCNLTFCTFGTHIKPENNAREMLENCVSILARAEQGISQSNLSKRRKATLIQRLEQVRATPLMLLATYYDEYYPDKPERKADCLAEFSECVKRGKVDTSGERWSMSQYLAEIGAPVAE